MLAVLLLATLSATRPVDVVVSRAVDVPSKESAEVAEQLVAALRDEGLTVASASDTAARLRSLGSPRSETCAAARPCVARLGALLQSHLIISIDLGRIGGQLAAAVEAINPADTKLVQDRAGNAPFAPLFKAFAKQLRPRVPDVPAPEPKVSLVPDTPSPEPQIAVDAPTPLPVKVTAIAGGTAAAAAIAALMVGVVTNGQLEGARYQSGFGTSSRLTASQAQGLANTANGAFTAAAITGALAVALGGTSLALWLGSDR